MCVRASCFGGTCGARCTRKRHLQITLYLYFSLAAFLLTVTRKYLRSSFGGSTKVYASAAERRAPAANCTHSPKSRPTGWWPGYRLPSVRPTILSVHIHPYIYTLPALIIFEWILSSIHFTEGVLVYPPSHLVITHARFLNT